MARAPRLSIREQEFVKAYAANGGNGTKAAIAAGYSPPTAGQQASRLLKRTQVLHALGRSAERASLTTAQALQHVSRIASQTPQRVTTTDVLKANELILRVNGALSDKHHDTRVTVTIGFLSAAPTRDAVAISAAVLDDVRADGPEDVPLRPQVTLLGESDG